MKHFTQHSIFLAAFAAGLLSTSAYAVNCGSIFSDVTLTLDLVCSNNGFVVSGNNITINLNGHTLSCTGYNCGISDAIPTSSGITSDGYSGLKVIGPGTIAGFSKGIHVGGGTNHTVSSIVITGTGESGIEIKNVGTSACGTQIVNVLNPPPPNSRSA